MPSPITRPTLECRVGADELGRWRVVVPSAPDLPPIVVASTESAIQVAFLVRERIAEHFAIPTQSFGIDMGAWR